jgi:hypothetical protein
MASVPSKKRGSQTANDSEEGILGCFWGFSKANSRVGGDWKEAFLEGGFFGRRRFFGEGTIA